MKQESEYIKKIKVRMILIGILVVSVFTAISFGFYYMGASQKGESGVSSITCFDMDFQDGDSINLTNAVSISDEMGLKTNPYHFELTNNCDTPMNYYVILNVKENSFSDDLISVSLDGRMARVLSTRPENSKFDKPAGYSKSYILDRGVLNKDEPISYDVRLWINADATYEQVQSKSWEAQIKVVSTVKELEDEILAQGIPNELMKRVENDKFWQHSENIITATFENTLNPKENVAYTYDVSELQDGSVMSYLVPNAEDNTKYDLYIQANGKIIANPDSSYLFFSFYNMQNINNLGKLDTSYVINMSNMFGSCSSLKTLDVSNFDTSNVTDMSGMFVYCRDLITLNLNSFNTKRVLDMSGMFQNCRRLKVIDVSSFDTSNVTNMSKMFSMYNSTDTTTVEISEIRGLENFDAGNVTDMSMMFYYCSSLTAIDLSNFNTSNVVNMTNMFYNCNNLITTLTVKGTKCIYFIRMFGNAATEAGASITVNYTVDTSTLVDNMIATKSSNSNVVKGSQVA